MNPLSQSRALWNRSSLDLRSDEILAQIIDRGSLEDWRALFDLARGEPALRQRIAALVRRVPLPLPHFWLAALGSPGEDVDVGQLTPPYDRAST